MEIHHLVHNDRAIRCKTCGAMFEVSSRALTNPLRLMEWKEGIAAKHTCRTARENSQVRVVDFQTHESLSAYWSGEMRRLMPAQS